MTGGYSRTGGVVLPGLDSAVGPSLEIPGQESQEVFGNQEN